MVCMLKFLLLSAALVSNQMSSSCVEILRGYMANTNRANWQLVAQFVAADAIVQLQRRRRRKPIRRLLRDRRQLGEYFTLVRDMRNGDGTDFFQYFRMSVERFDRLVELLRPLIEPRRSTVVSLSAGEKLAFTLRYLAPGSTMRIIAKSYRISDSMAGRIVRQTCLALRQVLEPFIAVDTSTGTDLLPLLEVQTICGIPPPEEVARIDARLPTASSPEREMRSARARNGVVHINCPLFTMRCQSHHQGV
ncbi:uncharacterized protein LOC144114329 [Amblyomma americanum]